MHRFSPCVSFKADEENTEVKETKGKPKKAGGSKPNASQPSLKGLTSTPTKNK